MSSRMRRLTIIFIALTLILSGTAACALTATVVMRVSKTAQDSVIDVGEDLSIELKVDGVTPASYGWDFNGEDIIGADKCVYNIENAVVEDAGVYTVAAYDESGEVILTMEFLVRVIDPALPKAGDDTLSIGIVAAIMGISFAGLTAVMIKRRQAA